MKIKFQLTKFEKGLSFQILEQTDKFLNTDEKLRLEFKYSTNLKLVSERHTRFNLNQHELHLWGCDLDHKFEISSTLFESNERRDEWYEYILETIEDWANNADAFKEENDNVVQFLSKNIDGTFSI